MEAVICRLLPYAIGDGPFHMAADEVLLRSAESGVATLRFYGWAQATASLGYFQPHAVLAADPLLKSLPFVRRLSGGATLVHDHELTYCLALPAQVVAQSAEPWMPRMHRLIVEAFAELRLAGRLVPAAGAAVKQGDVLCFQQFTPGDLLCDGFKVVGSAQRKHHLHLMQHGGILLARSEHAPALPGLRELTGIDVSPAQGVDSLVKQLRIDTKWEFVEADWTPQERAGIDVLIHDKYGSPNWNEKR